MELRALLSMLSLAACSVAKLSGDTCNDSRACTAKCVNENFKGQITPSGDFQFFCAEGYSKPPTQIRDCQTKGSVYDQAIVAGSVCRATGRRLCADPDNDMSGCALVERQVEEFDSICKEKGGKGVVVKSGLTQDDLDIFC